MITPTIMILLLNVRDIFSDDSFPVAIGERHESHTTLHTKGCSSNQPKNTIAFSLSGNRTPVACVPPMTSRTASQSVLSSTVMASSHRNHLTNRDQFEVLQVLLDVSNLSRLSLCPNLWLIVEHSLMHSWALLGAGHFRLDRIARSPSILSAHSLRFVHSSLPEEAAKLAAGAL